ncbi:YhbY family RNA-binding protein [Parasporobacterium paucivorans]|uniref:RNA-binding protein n=1 Tax=Parasporobacterium paucivorans DSM 15970 TaxID=1122934 RepID=A0A1M6A548_9FIRM|nr:YhbY family RNA-binding protein [Parasporobacterium paucivorans]SHI31509.1 RNA-binding protein [Parasporobacterium paucivorans DSM 15970]
MTSKERALLKARASAIDPILSLGKSCLTPEFTEAVREALDAREMVKINVLSNCTEDPRELAQTLSERTLSQVVQVIGRKIVLYKEIKKTEKKTEKKPERKPFKKQGSMRRNV